ncbi:MAG: hypothetical protein ABF821_01095 [Gluconacetobacter sp.]
MEEGSYADWFDAVGTWMAAILALAALVLAKRASDTTNRIQEKTISLTREQHIFNIISTMCKSVNDSIYEVTTTYPGIPGGARATSSGAGIVINSAHARYYLAAAVNAFLNGNKLIDSFSIDDQEENRIHSYFDTYLTGRAAIEIRHSPLLQITKRAEQGNAGGTLSPDLIAEYAQLESDYAKAKTIIEAR